MPIHIINLPPDGLTEVQFSGLQPYTMYDMRMVAVNNAGNSYKSLGLFSTEHHYLRLVLCLITL